MSNLPLTIVAVFGEVPSQVLRKSNWENKVT